MPSEYYRRFADPRVSYVMVAMSVETDNGRPGQSFHVRMTEDEYQDFRDRARKQAKRGDWPPGPYRMPYEDSQARTTPDEPFGFESRTRWRNDPPPGYGGPSDFGRHEEAFFQFFSEDFRQNGAREESRQKAQEEARKKAEEERARRAKNQPPPMTTASARKRLGELAETEILPTMDLKTVYNKAKRRCHPDMVTGSHELWIELENIAHFLGIITKKQPKHNSASYTGRSPG